MKLGKKRTPADELALSPKGSLQHINFQLEVTMTARRAPRCGDKVWWQSGRLPPTFTYRGLTTHVARALAAQAVVNFWMIEAV